MHVEEKTGHDKHGEGAEDAGRCALRYGAAVPEEIQVGRAHEFIDDVARTHHCAYVGVGTLIGDENEKCLAEPDIGDDFIGGHGLGCRCRSVKGFKDHDADKAPEKLGTESREGRSAVLQEGAKSGGENGYVGFDGR